MKKNKKMIVGFLAPAVIIFLIVFLYPIIRTIMMSMYKIESVTDTMEWWTFVGLAGPPCSRLLHCRYQAAGNIPERGRPQQQGQRFHPTGATEYAPLL